MISEVEQITGRTIPTSILFEARTIRQLAQRLLELDLRSKSVTQLNPNGRLGRYLLFHGDYNGGGLYVGKLARLLGPDQPLFVIAPHDLGQEPSPSSIEAIAADRLSLLLALNLKGRIVSAAIALGEYLHLRLPGCLLPRGKSRNCRHDHSPTVKHATSMSTIVSFSTAPHSADCPGQRLAAW